MKTQTTNPTKIGENTNTRNFFQKTVILFAILAFTSFGFKAKAQTWSLTVHNTMLGGCDWIIKIIEQGTGNVLNTHVSQAGSGTTYYPCEGNVDNIAMVSNGTGICQGYTFGSGGVFTYTAVIPTCSSGTPCSNNIDCQGATGVVNCTAIPPVGNTVITVNIN